MEPVTLRLAANSGVLVEGGGLRLLVDGVYGENRYFTPPLKEVRKAVFGMDSLYRSLDYLLFTHRHVDHFSAVYADEYARNNESLRGLAVPAPGEDPASFLEDRAPLPKALARGVLREVAPPEGGRCVLDLEEGCRVTYLRCGHLDGRTYGTVLHCAILLELGRHRILFAGDADASLENRALLADLGPLDAVLVTPLFYLHPEGRRILAALGGVTVIDHLPFAEDDVTGLRPLAERVLRDYGRPGRDLALMEPGQTLLLDEACSLINEQ